MSFIILLGQNWSKDSYFSIGVDLQNFMLLTPFMQKKLCFLTARILPLNFKLFYTHLAIKPFSLSSSVYRFCALEILPFFNFCFLSEFCDLSESNYQLNIKATTSSSLGELSLHLFSSFLKKSQHQMCSSLINIFFGVYLP